jgi:hypothetical protein
MIKNSKSNFIGCLIQNMCSLSKILWEIINESRHNDNLFIHKNIFLKQNGTLISGPIQVCNYFNEHPKSVAEKGNFKLLTAYIHYSLFEISIGT